MAKLTDLPPEVLSLIFREFLSKTLTDHEYLCKWMVEDDAVHKRASLYRLSLVCRLFAKIALPLLYEQLFRREDIQRCLTSAESSEQYTEYFGQTCHLCIRISTLSRISGTSSQLISKMLPSFGDCSRLQHLKLYIDEFDSITIAFLRSLGSMPASQRLKSLSLDINFSGGLTTMLQDLCAFTSLKGLSIYMEEEGQIDGRSLSRLANLKESCLGDCVSLDTALACMSLVDPQILRRLSLTLDWETDSDALSRVLGVHHWTSLDSVRYSDATQSGYRSLIPQDSRLPALRHIRLDFYCHALSRAGLSKLPPGLYSFHAKNLKLNGLVDALNLIKDGSWLDSQIRKIRLDVRGSGRSRWHDLLPSKETIIALASEAILAAQAKDVVIEPANLVDSLRAIENWE